MNFLDSVSNVEIETPMALIYKALSPSLSTFETLPNPAESEVFKAIVRGARADATGQAL